MMFLIDQMNEWMNECGQFFKSLPSVCVLNLTQPIQSIITDVRPFKIFFSGSIPLSWKKIPPPPPLLMTMVIIIWFLIHHQSRGRKNFSFFSFYPFQIGKRKKNNEQGANENHSLVLVLIKKNEKFFAFLSLTEPKKRKLNSFFDQRKKNWTKRKKNSSIIKFFLSFLP